MLSGCETPLVTSGGSGPSFQIKEMSERDKIALQLADNNSKYYRDRKMKATYPSLCTQCSSPDKIN